jgi:two-component system, chemotaxis family, protein-glutamate methylesterase/glutaminase
VEPLVSDKKIRIIIVDSSAVIRRLLGMMLATDPRVEVVATAGDPFEARSKLIQLRPDVMTLDLDMPKLDGMTFLHKVMTHMPLRVLVISNLSDEQNVRAQQALKQWDFEIIKKPMVNISQPLPEQSRELIAKVKRLVRHELHGDGLINVHKSYQPLAPLQTKVTTLRGNERLIVIAASTGGTEALKNLFAQIPAEMPPVLIVQHMPKGFTKRFADSLDKVSKMKVKEADNDERLLPGVALLAPGDYHLEVQRRGKAYYTLLHQEDIRFGLRPSADYLFRSVVNFGQQVLGVIMTGMGKDGAAAMKLMRDNGCKTVGQNEKSCVVFGMSKVAHELGAVEQLGDVRQIAATMTQFAKESVIKSVNS